MATPEGQHNPAELLNPARYLGRAEPGYFDPYVHAAGALDWVALMQGENIAELAESLRTYIADAGFKPLVVFNEPYVPPDTYDEVDRFNAAVGFLKAQGMGQGLINQLNNEMLSAVQDSDGSINDIDATRAVIAAEALARGEYDPFNLIYNGEIIQATDSWWNIFEE